jgi:DNA-binding NtrC family response regulator
MNKWRRRNSGGPVKISEDALAILTSYSWPGNVRELENCIQRAAVVASGDTITPQDLPPDLLATAADRDQPAADGDRSAAPELSLSAACRAIVAAADRDPAVLKQLGLTKAALEKFRAFAE